MALYPNWYSVSRIALVKALRPVVKSENVMVLCSTLDISAIVNKNIQSQYHQAASVVDFIPSSTFSQINVTIFSSLFSDLLKYRLHSRNAIFRGPIFQSLFTMSNLRDHSFYLDNARIAPEIFELRPDYRALLMVITHIPAGPSDSASESILLAAEATAKSAISKTNVNDIPHVAEWREAYKAFGAKPKKTLNSLEALLRRTEAGLPRVNRFTDIYNAISIKHQIPLGGEDLNKYQGAPFLIRAKGDEKFDTKSGGDIVTENPSPGEAVWCDDGGVTCRRWNWRQCSRTALSDGTTNVLFILDALAAVTDEALNAAGDELSSELSKLSPEVKVSRRVLRASA